MDSLKKQLGEGERRRRAIEGACRVLDQEVDSKSGLGGIAIKAAFKVVKGIKPGFVGEVVDNLLDDFLDALDPFYQRAKSAGGSPKSEIMAQSGPVAEALLSITDQRAVRAKRAVIKKTYDKLRPSAKHHVETAAPRIGELIEEHAD